MEKDLDLGTKIFILLIVMVVWVPVGSTMIFSLAITVLSGFSISPWDALQLHPWFRGW